MNVTFRGTSTSSSGRGVTPIVLTFAVITCRELGGGGGGEGREEKEWEGERRERGRRKESVPVCVCVHA